MEGLSGSLKDGRKNGSTKRSNTRRRNSDSTTANGSNESRSCRSTDVNSLSRFPYHDSEQRPAREQRSRSYDLHTPEESTEFGQAVDSHATPSQARRGRRSDTQIGTSSCELDASFASRLMLQESSTFPDIHTEPQSICWNFAMEHRIFLKAALDLLAQRDKVATEVGMNDPNVLRSGPLKKASHLMRGIWKVKYVEIRRGMFSYYEDAATGARLHHQQQLVNNSTSSGDGTGESSSFLRKNIPLEANSCHCRAVRLHQKALNITPRGAIFELALNGRPKRLWMANSREERQAWIQAIHDAMVGGSVTRGGNPAQKSSAQESKTSQHKDDIKKYQKVQAMLRSAKSKEEYVIALRTIFHHDLNVPVKIIIAQTDQETKPSGDVKGAFHEGDVKFGVDQLYKDLLRDTLKINDEVYQGKSGHAPERITGALARKIMLCGRRSDESFDDDKGSANRSSKYDMTESQALAYARDVLLSGNRTRSGGDSYFCVNTLCKNEDLVVLVPSSMEAEPVSVTVTRDDDDEAASISHDLHSKSGWLRTRRRSRNPWVKAYFVLSEGTLSFYEHALPRPHGLQGQLAMSEATMSAAREEQKGNGFVLSIKTKDNSDRQLLFESEERLLVWAYALECTAKAKGGAEPAPLMKAMKGMMSRMPRVSIVGVVGATPSRATVDDAGTTEGTSLAEAALKEHVANLGLDFKALEGRLAAYANQTATTVKVAIEAGTVYKVCTLDPEGDENRDTWAVIDATFLQDFRVSGGPNGRIIRGEETVRVDVTQCSASASMPLVMRLSTHEPSASPTSTSAIRPLQLTKLLRSFSDDFDDNGKKKEKT
jgi:PH domain